MTYSKALFIVGISFIILNGFIRVHGSEYKGISYDFNESLECISLPKNKYIVSKDGLPLYLALEQVCSYGNDIVITTIKKTVFINLKTMKMERLDGRYRG